MLDFFKKKPKEETVEKPKRMAVIVDMEEPKDVFEDNLPEEINQETDDKTS